MKTRLPWVARVPFRSSNRPDTRMEIPNGVMFHEVGPTGWGRIRGLGDYKGNKKEGDFSHLHDKFANPEDVA